jgi:hypothetical protein
MLGMPILKVLFSKNQSAPAQEPSLSCHCAIVVGVVAVMAAIVLATVIIWSSWAPP